MRRQAYAAIRAGMALTAAASPRERALVEALAARFAADGVGDRPALDRAYAAAMARVATAYPDDPDVQTLVRRRGHEHDAVGLLAEGRIAEARDHPRAARRSNA